MNLMIQINVDNLIFKKYFGKILWNFNIFICNMLQLINLIITVNFTKNNNKILIVKIFILIHLVNWSNFQYKLSRWNNFLQIQKISMNGQIMK